MKILPFVVLSIGLLSSFLSQAFLTIPNSPAALTQNVETPIKSSEEKKSLTLDLEPQIVWKNPSWAYFVKGLVGTPKEVKTVPASYQIMMSLNSVNTSLFTDACSKDEDTAWNCSTKDPFIPESSSSFMNDTGDNVVISTANTSKVLGYMGTDYIDIFKDHKGNVSTHILFRVNATMERNFTGLISLSPNKNSFLEVLKNNSAITEQQFMYTSIYPGFWIAQVAGMIFGEIPEIYEGMPWFKISNDKWQIETNYVGINGQKGQDCNAINGGGVAFFNESNKILLPPKAYDMLLLQLEDKKRNSSKGVGYLCTPDAMKQYPNISIYTSQYKIDIPASVYLDSNNWDGIDWCPLAVDFLNDTNSCITLGYYFFASHQVVFSKDRQQIGLLKKESFKKVKVFPFENVTGIASLILLVMVFGFVFVRSSQKEEELRIDIDNTPRQVRSASYYEYSYVE